MDKLDDLTQAEVFSLVSSETASIFTAVKSIRERTKCTLPEAKGLVLHFVDKHCTKKSMYAPPAWSVEALDFATRP
jgi:hypothetical protein